MIRLATSVVIIALEALLGTLVTDSVAQAYPPPSEGELTISEETGSLRGRFSNAEAEVKFQADRTQEGRVTVELEIGDLTFELAYDPEAEALRLDGQGGIVTPEGGRALEALSILLEERWEPYTAPISPEKHLAFRTILLLSEAPAGHPLEERTIEASSLPPNVETEPEPRRQ